MPESDPDYTAHIAILERKLRAHRRNIIGCSEMGKSALTNLDSAPLFEVQLESAITEWEKFQKVWDERDALQNVAGGDFPSEQWQALYDSCRREIIEAKSFLLRIQRLQSAQNLTPASSGDNRQSINTTLGTSSAPRAHHLPKIAIPQFSGDLKKWTHFKDTFLSMVHNEYGLTNIEKFHYLLSTVRGEPASLLSSFPVEDRSYSLAWEKLVSTYDNPRILASLFIQQILEFDSRSAKGELQRYEKFLTGVADNITGFKALNVENSTDVLLGFLALRGLDQETRSQFEISRISSDSFPTANEVIEFVRKRKMALTISQDITPCMPSTRRGSFSEAQRSLGAFPRRTSPKYRSVNFLEPGPISTTKRLSTRSSTNHSSKVHHQGARGYIPRACAYCKENHDLPGCYKFCNIPLEERKAFVSSLKCCTNCLRQNHHTSECRSKFTCRFCRLRHHSLLHEDINQPRSKEPSVNSTPPQFAGFGSNGPAKTPNNSYILGTAQLYIIGPQKCLYPVRAILDSGSQHTFVTKSVIERIGFEITAYNSTIVGLGGNPVTRPVGSVNCTLKSRINNDKFESTAVVVNTISPPLPTTAVEPDVVQRLSSLHLADEDYHTPGVIDLLIGIDLYPHIIYGAPFSSGVGELFLQPTAFGLVVMGKTSVTLDLSSTALFSGSQQSIETQLKAFWEIEEPRAIDRQDPNDTLCEEHFVQTHRRTSEGRYTVRLPLNPSSGALGRNRDVVRKRFLNLERKFHSDQQLASSYKQFMKEYEDLGHMSKAQKESDYLIPHHAVWQENPSGRKIRVVFDASCGAPKESLNSILLAGPKLQLDLAEVLITFRLFLIPLCADLVKMYRQILVQPEDRYLQHILWRNEPTEKLQEMELNTVTYGTRSSAYQALRVIKQLVIDEGSCYPKASEAINRSIYVDDIVSGADTLDEAIELQHQLCGIFSKGGFTLSKWASTIPELIPENSKLLPLQLHQYDLESIKILGLVWNPATDAFSYAVTQPPTNNVTKRLVLSAIARIFDPLGLLSPVIFLVKVLLQDIWRQQIGWDDLLPPDLSEKWSSITQEWSNLSHLSVPRYVSYPKAETLLIGFCDASTKGYAASVYLRVTQPDGSTKVNLIKSKTKVAPLKYMSVARLELCGALLLTRLMSSIKIPELNIHPPTCYTDSRVVLSWLNTPTYQLKIFEANRVSEIVSSIASERWHHVSSENNPSDLASRGCLPSALIGNRLWWHGPSWLLNAEINCPYQFEKSPICNLSATPLQITTKAKHSPEEIMKRFSNLTLLIRVVALIMRIARHARSKDVKCHGPITTEEFINAKHHCAFLVQQDMSTRDLTQLSPFVDNAGIIRVGGRLQEAPIEYSRRHPILLPRQSHFSQLIVDEIHKRNFHAGPSLTLSLLRNEFWIPGALRLIRKQIQRCVHCRLRKAKPTVPFMAPLPIARFMQQRAFLQVGLDYAGPFLIKDSNRRKSVISKAYLCLFVCMSTRALHLETVSALTTSAFLAALDRFISRRGLPQSIWSDRGTNFVGASRFLKDVYRFIAEQEDDIVRNLTQRSIEWKFIPPRAPHFGGLWEAGVKSAKSLLTGSVGTQPFTFEELCTTFIKIEGILNSRPLIALTEDPENFDFLTPAHFLIGTSLSMIPEPMDDSVPSKLSDRWELIQSRIKSVWQRWHLDYLHSLQQRTKWDKKHPNLKNGDLVIMVEHRSLVGHWPVARVIATYPGKDGVVRTVTILTPAGRIFVRSVASLAPLFPLDTQEVVDSSTP